MKAMGGGRPGEDQPDPDHLDLDQPPGADAHVVELFRAGLRPRGPASPDLGAIERRARRRHRRAQAVGSAVVAAAAALTAVLVVLAPGPAHGGGQGVPAVPTPSVTQTAPVKPPQQVTGSSLLSAGDLTLTAAQTGLGPGGRKFQAVGKAGDLAGQLVVDRFCGGPALPQDAPSAGWTRRWESAEADAEADYVVNEQVLRWPGHSEQALAVFEAFRSQDYCALGYGYEASSSRQNIGDDAEVTVPVLVRHVAGGDGRQNGQAVAMWDDIVVIVDLSGPGSAIRDGAGDSAGEVAAYLLGVAVNRLAGRDRTSAPWSAPSLSTDVPIRTGDGP